MESTKSRISSQKLGSRDFCKIFNSVFNRSKSCIPPLFNCFEVLSSSKDKIELFAQLFSTNCSLNSSGHNLPDFTSQCNASLCDVHITPQSVAKVISKLHSSTASGPDNIPVIVLQRWSPELSFVLFKLFNKCLVESSFP